MKKVIIVALGVLAMLAAAIGVSNAEPGPNGHNDHGLCTAYFNGQKVGHGPGEDTDDPPPFQGLEDRGEQYTQTDSAPNNDNDRDGTPNDANESEELTDAENIFNYCNDGGLIGGNPEHGRFTCSDPGVAGPSTDTESDPECERNDKPGNG